MIPRLIRRQTGEGTRSLPVWLPLGVVVLLSAGIALVVALVTGGQGDPIVTSAGQSVAALPLAGQEPESAEAAVSSRILVPDRSHSAPVISESRQRTESFGGSGVSPFSVVGGLTGVLLLGVGAALVLRGRSRGGVDGATRDQKGGPNARLGLAR